MSQPVAELLFVVVWLFLLFFCGKQRTFKRAVGKISGGVRHIKNRAKVSKVVFSKQRYFNGQRV